MQPDSKPQHEKTYLVGMISMFLCLAFILFGIYITPYLIWKLGYVIPGFVIELIQYFRESYQLSDAASRLVVALLFFIPGLVFGFIASKTSKKYDYEELEEEAKEENEAPIINEEPIEVNEEPEVNEELVHEQALEEKREDRQETFRFGLKLFTLILLCVLVLLLIHILLSAG